MHLHCWSSAHMDTFDPFAAVILQKSQSEQTAALHVPTRAGRGVVVLPLCHPDNVPWLMTSACRIGWEIGGIDPRSYRSVVGKWSAFIWKHGCSLPNVMLLSALHHCFSAVSQPPPLSTPPPHRPPSSFGISQSADFYTRACLRGTHRDNKFDVFFLSFTKVAFVGIRAPNQRLTSLPPPLLSQHQQWKLTSSVESLGFFFKSPIGFTMYRCTECTETCSRFGHLNWQNGHHTRVYVCVVVCFCTCMTARTRIGISPAKWGHVWDMFGPHNYSESDNWDVVLWSKLGFD